MGMKKLKITCLLFSIFLLFLFSSCPFFNLFGGQEKEEEEIGEFDDINIFDASLLPDWNSFITRYSIAADKNYLYAVTDGTKEYPGKIIKILKNGESPVIKILLEEASKKGYNSSRAYEIESIDYYGNQLILKCVPNKVQFENCEFEVFCLSSEDLSVQWRWAPEENSRIDYHGAGHPSIPKWDEYFIIYYTVEEEEGYYLVFLDSNGKESVKRYIKKSCPIEESNICIVDNKLLLHQLYEPLIIYDLNKLIDPDYDFEDCVDFAFTNDVYEANLFSNIVTDGNNAYFCCWKDIDREKSEFALMVYAVSLSDYRTHWSYEIIDKQFDGVHSILLDNGKLFLAADYGCVYCLDSTNGKLNWKTTITDAEHPKNLLCEGCIVKDYFVIPCASNGWLYYFDINTGKIKGKHYIPVFGGNRHCVAEDDYLYITTGSYIARLRLKEK